MVRLRAFSMVWLLPGICGQILASGAPAPEMVVQQEDPVSNARRLTTSGRRAEALKILEDRLVQKPGDSDARVLHGIILSWEGRYDEARADLEMVLSGRRDHGDALPALINVEMWSGHPERAEELARDALRRRPNDPALLLAHARALRSLERPREALTTLHRLIEVDPGNQQAIEMQQSLGDSLRRWEASVDHSSEWFSDGRKPWMEEQIALRGQTSVGSVITRFSRADRFSLSSRQAEIDLYPRFRAGTYAYLNVGYSPDAVLYPRNRLGADLFQSLGGGFEGSAGYRRLGFGQPVHIYTAALSKYYGNWMVTGRAYITPDSVGTSHSVQISVRRYLGGGTDYWGLRYGRGSSPVEQRSLQDIQILNASSFAAELIHKLNRRMSFLCRVGYSREDRLLQTGLRHYLAEGMLYFRF